MRIPPLLTVPDWTNSILDPMAAICCWACNCAPWPTLTMAITAPTPIMTPSIVRIDRILLRARARMAMRMMANKSITSSSRLLGHFWIEHVQPSVRSHLAQLHQARDDRTNASIVRLRNLVKINSPAYSSQTC